MLPSVPAKIRNPKYWEKLAQQSANGWADLDRLLNRSQRLATKVSRSKKNQADMPPNANAEPAPTTERPAAANQISEPLDNLCATQAATLTLPVLTDDQQRALATLTKSLDQGGYFACLLEGITGSGKTEVYLRFITYVLAQDQTRQVLLLVPEINLTPQFEAELRKRFPGKAIAILHSGLSEGSRSQGWLAAHMGQARIILGTRLAILASIPFLSAIIVDEEHDISYKQQEGVRYSARDLAVWRAYQMGIPVILGSATPALETWQHAQAQRYAYVKLSQRAQPDATLPTIRLIDLNKERKSGQHLQQGMSHALLEAIATRLQRGEQSLLYLNRRGYAPVVCCEACGWLSGCTRCATWMVFHRESKGNRLRCHHCGLEKKVPRCCPDCGNIDLTPLGRGTQRIEGALAELFPHAKILRIDADSTRRKGQAQQLFDAVHAGEIDILVGTQMIAKGHDFQRVTLVGIINSDAALYSHDFRASERLFAQLMQVAGRAGRTKLPGEVLVQTLYPQAEIFQALLKQDYADYAGFLSAQRKTAGFPPFSFQALLTVESKEIAACLYFLQQAREQAILFPECVNHEVNFFDPVPCPLSKKDGKEYAQILIESLSRQALQRALEKLIEAMKTIRPRQKWLIERDPAFV
jgi:primosomal protein N' (replication factor Y)